MYRESSLSLSLIYICVCVLREFSLSLICMRRLHNTPYNLYYIYIQYIIYSLQPGGVVAGGGPLDRLRVVVEGEAGGRLADDDVGREGGIVRVAGVQHDGGRLVDGDVHPCRARQLGDAVGCC